MIDTFSFSSLNGWSRVGTNFSGSFTGTVEASALIELSDLIAFHLSGNIEDFGFAGGLSNLTLFSYDTKGGASSLGFIETAVCVGAPSVLSLTCNPGGNNPGSATAVVILTGVWLALRLI